MNKLLALALHLGAGIGLAGHALAGLQNDIPSCYAANNLAKAAPAPERELFVLIDQTTVLDERLRESVKENAGRFIGPGNAFTVASFSAFSQGRYLEVTSAGAFEPALGSRERDATGVRVLRNFDACMQGQGAYGRKLLLAALDKSLNGSSRELVRSDVISSIREIGARVKQSAAREKIVLVVSDMLENSSLASFYANNGVRRIDPAKTLKIAQDNHLLGDFGGARVYVLGAGLVPEAATAGKNGVYRDPLTMAALQQFWRDYFVASNARLVEFGQPALLAPLK